MSLHRLASVARVTRRADLPQPPTSNAQRAAAGCCLVSATILCVWMQGSAGLMGPGAAEDGRSDMGTSLSRAGLGLGDGDDRLDQSRSGVATRRTARPSGPVERSRREVQWVDAARIDGGMRMCKNGHASGASVRFVGVCVVACGARGRAGASREARANAVRGSQPRAVRNSRVGAPGRIDDAIGDHRYAGSEFGSQSHQYSRAK